MKGQIRFGDMLPGSGGFVNIVHGARRLIFCGTFTAGGLRASVSPAGVSIESEGRVRRFVPRVGQITFVGQEALRRGASVTVVTERAILELAAGGFTVTRVAQGVDLHRDVLDLLPFPVAIGPDVVPGGREEVGHHAGEKGGQRAARPADGRR